MALALQPLRRLPMPRRLGLLRRDSSQDDLPRKRVAAAMDLATAPAARRRHFATLRPFGLIVVAATAVAIVYRDQPLILWAALGVISAVALSGST